MVDHWGHLFYHFFPDEKISIAVLHISSYKTLSYLKLFFYLLWGVVVSEVITILLIALS